MPSLPPILLAAQISIIVAFRRFLSVAYRAKACVQVHRPARWFGRVGGQLSGVRRSRVWRWEGLTVRCYCVYDCIACVRVCV